MRAYLDCNATTQPAPEVIAAIGQVLSSNWGNPSSVHRAGIEARAAVDSARENIAALVGARSVREIVLLSGGTESVNLAIRGSLAAQPSRRVVVSSPLEHSAVRSTLAHLAKQGVESVWLPHAADGRVELDALESLLRSRGSEIALVSVMWANNELGHFQPVADAAALCRSHGVRFHTDATAAVGKVPCDFAAAGVDMASFCAHKLHGPTGVGALYLRRDVRIDPSQTGGHHERERRAGTENVPGIIGFGVAAQLAGEWLASDGPAQSQARHERLEAALLARCSGVRIHLQGQPRLWSTTSAVFPRLAGDAILIALSERGVAASAGSACLSGSVEPSPVVLALGVDQDTARATVRFSISRQTTDAEIDFAVEQVAAVVAQMQRAMAALA